MLDMTRAEIHNEIATAYSLAIIKAKGILEDESPEWVAAVQAGIKYADNRLELKRRIIDRSELALAMAIEEGASSKDDFEKINDEVENT